MFAITLILICVFAAAAGQIIFKKGISGLEKIESTDDLLKIQTIIDIVANKYILFGLLLYGAVFLLWMAAMSTLDISFMYPMLSLAYLIAALMAVIFLGENVSLMRWAGTVLVVAGCLLISRS